MIIWTIAKTTIGDALRKKVLQIFLVVGIGLIIISLSFSQTLSFSTREGASTDIFFVKSFALGLMAVAAWLISLVMGVSLIPQEIERRTIYTILAKPVKRYEFILGKYLGAALTLAINVGLMGVVFIAVCVFKAMGAAQPLASKAGGINVVGMQHLSLFDWNMVWGVVMVYLQFMILSSVVLLFSVFLTPTVNFFMGLGFYIVGLMGSMTETLAKSEQAPVLVKGFYTVIHALIPNFDKYNVANGLLHPETNVVNMARYTSIIALDSVLYALGAMVLAVIIFWRREV